MFIDGQTNARMEVFRRVAVTLKWKALFNKLVTMDMVEAMRSKEVLDVGGHLMLNELVDESSELHEIFEEVEATLKIKAPVNPKEFKEFKKSFGPRVQRMVQLGREFSALRYYIGNIGNGNYENEFNYKIANEAKSIALELGCHQNDKFCAAFRVVAFNAYADCYYDLGKELDARELRQISKTLCQEHSIGI